MQQAALYRRGCFSLIYPSCNYITYICINEYRQEEKYNIKSISGCNKRNRKTSGTVIHLTNNTINYSYIHSKYN